MICVLFIRKESLPQTRTGVISTIVDRCENWESIRSTGEKGMKTFENPLLKLGKFVFKRLQQDDSLLMFDKVHFKVQFKSKCHFISWNIFIISQIDVQQAAC